MARSGRKTTTLLRGHEYFIPTKFHQNPSSGSGEKVEKFTDEDDGRRAMAFVSGELIRKLCNSIGNLSNYIRELFN